jgi:phage tail-like protein
MTVKGTVRKVEMKHRFRLSVPGYDTARIATIGELKKATEVVEVPEGGEETPLKVAGRTTVEAIEVTEIAGMSEALYDLFLLTSNVFAGGGEVDQGYKMDMFIEQLDAKKNVMKRWILVDAWCSDFSTGDWDAGASEGRAITATIQMQSWRLQPAGA